MTPFAQNLVEAIGQRLAVQLDHPFGDYHRYYAEQIVQEIAPIVNSEAQRLVSELLECLKDARRLLTDQDAIDLAHIDEVIAKARIEPKLTKAISEFFARTYDGESEADVLIDIISDAILADRAELDRLRDENASLRSGLSLQPISTADKDAERLTLGIVRNGVLEELHIGGFRYAINDDEVSCWWSDQCDDEIVPTHWMPAPLSPDNSTQKKEG